MANSNTASNRFFSLMHRALRFLRTTSEWYVQYDEDKKALDSLKRIGTLELKDKVLLLEVRKEVGINTTTYAYRESGQGRVFETGIPYTILFSQNDNNYCEDDFINPVRIAALARPF